MSHVPGQSCPEPSDKLRTGSARGSFFKLSFPILPSENPRNIFFTHINPMPNLHTVNSVKMIR